MARYVSFSLLTFKDLQEIKCNTFVECYTTYIKTTMVTLWPGTAIAPFRSSGHALKCLLAKRKQLLLMGHVSPPRSNRQTNANSSTLLYITPNIVLGVSLLRRCRLFLGKKILLCVSMLYITNFFLYIYLFEYHMGKWIFRDCKKVTHTFFKY